MGRKRMQLAMRATQVMSELNRRFLIGELRIGPYQTTDLVETCVDCLDEATKLFYFDFAGNRTRELEFTVECLEALLVDEESPVPSFGQARFSERHIRYPTYVGRAPDHPLRPGGQNVSDLKEDLLVPRSKRWRHD